MGLSIDEIAPQGVPRGMSVTEYVDDAGVTNYFLEASNGTGNRRFGSRWWVCPKCGHEFPELKMVNVAGTFYCIEFKDYIEAQKELEE